MKIYVVSVNCSICGVVLDYRVAERIVECERARNARDSWVEISEYETDDYIPLIAGLNPYEVMFYDDPQYAAEVRPASLTDFVRNSSLRIMRDGKRGLRCDVYALGKEHALRLATILKDQYKMDKEKVGE